MWLECQKNWEGISSKTKKKYRCLQRKPLRQHLGNKTRSFWCIAVCTGSGSSSSSWQTLSGSKLLTLLCDNVCGQNFKQCTSQESIEDVRCTCCLTAIQRSLGIISKADNPVEILALWKKIAFRKCFFFHLTDLLYKLSVCSFDDANTENRLSKDSFRFLSSFDSIIFWHPLIV